MANFRDAQGANQDLEIGMDQIRAAAGAGISLRDYVNATYPTDPAAYGDTFSQLCASEGIVLRPSKAHGIRSPKLSAIINGRTQLEAGAVVRNPTNQARVLLMPAIGALVEDKLLADLTLNASAFDSMVALDTTIADEWLLWPEANFSKPEAARSQVTSQLAKPANMLTLTTSEKQIRIPTVSLGIEWSDKVTSYLNLDFIALSIARQAAVEKNENALNNLMQMYNGDADIGQSSLATLGKVVKANTLDTSIVAAGALSELAFILWLNTNSTKRRITHLITDVRGALAIQNRTGKPTVTSDNPTSPRITSEMTLLNPMFGDVKVFIMDPASSWPANTILGIDANYAMQRITSTNANYEATEQFVLERKSAMRFDYGTLTRRLYLDAFEVLSLTL